MRQSPDAAQLPDFRLSENAMLLKTLAQFGFELRRGGTPWPPGVRHPTAAPPKFGFVPQNTGALRPRRGRHPRHRRALGSLDTLALDLLELSGHLRYFARYQSPSRPEYLPPSTAF